MDFNLRAISLGESTATEERINPSELLGSTFQFRMGITVPITFPEDPAAFDVLGNPNLFLPSIFKWTRLYRYPTDTGHILDVLGTADSPDGTLRFKLITMLQASSPRGPRPPIQFLSAGEMDYDACASWLVNKAEDWALDPSAQKRRLVLCRPNVPKIRPLRFAWVGPDLVDNYAMATRLLAIGRVYGVELSHILPHSFPHVRARLNEEMPLRGLIVSRYFAPHLTDAVIPSGLEDVTLFCDSSDRYGLETQITTWIELVGEELRTKDEMSATTEKQILLTLMLKGMVSHSKIGQYNHCDRTTVLTAIRARKMNVAAAEELLDLHCDQHQETRESNTFFLWKGHNDGRQYFLNPKKMEEIKRLLEG